MTAAEKDQKVIAGLASLEELRSNLADKEEERTRYVRAFKIAKVHAEYALFSANGQSIAKPPGFGSLPEMWWPSPDEVRELARDINDLSNEIARKRAYLQGLSPGVASLLL